MDERWREQIIIELVRYQESWISAWHVCIMKVDGLVYVCHYCSLGAVCIAVLWYQLKLMMQNQTLYGCNGLLVVSSSASDEEQQLYVSHFCTAVTHILQVTPRHPFIPS